MNREMANEWLRSASGDLETIEAIIDNSNLTHIVAFHSQQCVEKSIKAILELYEVTVPKTHSILKLSKVAEEFFDIGDKETADELDKLYIDTRYPGDFGLLPDGKPTSEKARALYRFARNIYADTEIIVKKGTSNNR
jgi:HEPN domain-containing protein